MDERSTSWIHLLPPEATIHAAVGQSPILDRLHERVSPTGDTWVAWNAGAKDLPPLLPFRAVVLISPHVSAGWLRERGFSHVRAFKAIPTLKSVRWLVPAENRRVAAGAWDLYSAQTPRARLAKAVTRMAARGLGGALPGTSILVAQRAPSPLEARLARAVSSPNLSLAIAPHWPGQRYRLLIRIAAPDGKALGYAKLGCGAAAGGIAVRREAEFTAYVRSLDLRRAAVPELLYHGAEADGYLMVSAPASLESEPSHLRITPEHDALLAELALHTGATTTHAALDQLDGRIRALQLGLQPDHRRLLDSAVAAASSTPRIGDLPTTLSHGDFTPWNLRALRRSGRLVLFDWEWGQSDQFLLWDSFHFQVQLNALVHRRTPGSVAEIAVREVAQSALARSRGLSISQVQALFLAYLVDTTVRWFEEPRDSGELPTGTIEQHGRLRMLKAALGTYEIAFGSAVGDVCCGA